MANRDRFENQYRFIIAALIAERRRLGLTQTDIARSMQTDQSQISKLERRERRLDIIDYVRYCRALGLDLAAILSRLPTENAEPTSE